MSDRPLHEPQRVTELHDRSAPALIGDLITHVTELFRKEMMLLRAEMHEKTKQITTAGVMLAGALVVGIVGLIYLAGAAVLGLVNAGLAPVWSVLIVGGVLSLIALMMAGNGRSKLNSANLAPRRTAESLSKDATMAKERIP